VPNGCFGDADCGGGVIAMNNRRACDDRPARPQSVCWRFTYDPLAEGEPGYEGYLGILFQGVGPGGEDDIGKVAGLPVAPGATRAVFWAKVGAGSVEVAFRAGGANNWEGNTDPALPYKDDFGVPADVVLGTEFRQIAIDLTGVSYTRVVSPFGWAIEAKGRTEPIELFIDDVRWE
jgi:hypothetical protein